MVKAPGLTLSCCDLHVGAGTLTRWHPRGEDLSRLSSQRVCPGGMSCPTCWCGSVLRVMLWTCALRSAGVERLDCFRQSELRANSDRFVRGRLLRRHYAHPTTPNRSRSMNRVPLPRHLVNGAVVRRPRSSSGGRAFVCCFVTGHQKGRGLASNSRAHSIELG
jgi:hypothetical protein